MLKIVPSFQNINTVTLKARVFSQQKWVTFQAKVNFLQKLCITLPSAPFSWKPTIPVLPGFFTKQNLSRCKIQKRKSVKFCASSLMVLISPGSKLQLKLQKILTTTKCLYFPWHTLFIDPTYWKLPWKTVLLRIYLSHSLALSVPPCSWCLTKAPEICPLFSSTLKAPKSALKQRKRNVAPNAWVAFPFSPPCRHPYFVLSR